MPTYKNISSETVVLNSLSFKPLEEKEVNFYTADPRLKETNPEPIYSPVQYSEQVGSGSVKITDNLTENVNTIRIASKTNSSLISFNSADKPKVLLTNALELIIRPVRNINEIFVHEGTVSIELWNEVEWRN